MIVNGPTLVRLAAQWAASGRSSRPLRRPGVRGTPFHRRGRRRGRHGVIFRGDTRTLRTADQTIRGNVAGVWLTRGGHS